MTTRKRRKPVDSPVKVRGFNPATALVRDTFGPYSYRVEGLKLGLEFEIESTNGRLPDRDHVEGSRVWKVVPDGSLRNGAELVCREPILYTDVPAALTEFDSIIKAARTEISNSIRCSTHVHMNVQDLTLTKLATLMTCYYVMEPMLSRFNGTDREHNMFALQAQYAPCVIDVATAVLSFEKGFDQQYKYNALNFMPLQRNSFGTLEFRAGRGVDKSAQELAPWIQMLEELYRVATTDFESPADVVTAFSNAGVEEFVADNFPRIAKGCVPLFTERELGDMVMNSVRFAQSFAFDVDWSSYEPEVVEAPKKKVGGDTYLDALGAVRRQVRTGRFQTHPAAAPPPPQPARPQLHPDPEINELIEEWAVGDEGGVNWTQIFNAE